MKKEIFQLNILHGDAERELLGHSLFDHKHFSFCSHFSYTFYSKDFKFEALKLKLKNYSNNCEEIKIHRKIGNEVIGSNPSRQKKCIKFNILIFFVSTP